MKLIHTAILFLAISSTFECKKKKKNSKHIQRPKGMGTNKTPDHCIKRGISFGVQPNLEGGGVEWLAAVCPGVMRPKKGKSGKKKKKKKKRSLERRGSSKESQWESCAWGMEHGAVCQRCHAGDPHLGKGKKHYPSMDVYLHGCAVRYQYRIVNWPHDSGPQQKKFLKWVKGQDTSNLPNKGLLNDICPGVYDQPGDGSNDSPYDACMWGWQHGSKCMALGPLPDLIVESAKVGCMHRYNM